jgi:predicted DNA-binding transcriptional regulator AlpA
VKPEELATELKIPVSTLYVWRSRGQGPKSFKAGRHVRYRRSSINAWYKEIGGQTVKGPH